MSTVTGSSQQQISLQFKLNVLTVMARQINSHGNYLSGSWMNLPLMSLLDLHVAQHLISCLIPGQVQNTTARTAFYLRLEATHMKMSCVLETKWLFIPPKAKIFDSSLSRNLSRKKQSASAGSFRCKASPNTSIEWNVTPATPVGRLNVSGAMSK